YCCRYVALRFRNKKSEYCCRYVALRFRNKKSEYCCRYVALRFRNKKSDAANLAHRRFLVDKLHC
ncbi:hypothetical protein ACIQVU_12230, partial [Lysinibacillus sp. NPDC098008]|uniref:hypothetical protein n=1 Tax=Lysinibacillus sp. NPDC098008 TaxID=3364146 RepID=UPI0038018C08